MIALIAVAFLVFLGLLTVAVVWAETFPEGRIAKWVDWLEHS